MIDFVPERPIEAAGRDAEIAADIDDDGADRAATHLLGDLFLGGEAGEARVGGLDVPRRGLPCGARHAYGGQADGRNREVPAALGAFAELGFQHRGPAQATGDAGEDDGDIGGAERSDEEGEAWGAGALLDRGGELLAVVDQLANEVEDAAEAAGHVGAGPRRIGLRGWGGELEGGGHERNKNIGEWTLSRKFFLSQAGRGGRTRRGEG